jgi:hypothetical protein
MGWGDVTVVLLLPLLLLLLLPLLLLLLLLMMMMMIRIAGLRPGKLSLIAPHPTHTHTFDTSTHPLQPCQAVKKGAQRGSPRFSTR